MSEAVKCAYLKKHPVFADVSDTIILKASNFARIRTVAKGEVIDYGTGKFSHLHLLIKGKIKICEVKDERDELIKDILSAPDIFGDLGLDGYIDADEYAEVLTENTVICCFNSADLKKVLGYDSKIILTYASLVSKKLKRMEDRHANLVFNDARSRLIDFMRNWARSEGSNVGDKIILNNYLTHSDIANVIDTSRQSVNVLFNELRDSGLLHYNRQYIELNQISQWQ